MAFAAHSQRYLILSFSSFEGEVAKTVAPDGVIRGV
jgi:hypothetical protein